MTGLPGEWWRSLVPWCFGVGGLFGASSLVAYLVAFRVIGQKLDHQAAIEWLLRWQDMRPLERWTVLRAYTRMDEDHKEGFRQVWAQLGCQAYREFKGFERPLLFLTGDNWLRKEVLIAWLPSPNPNLLRPWPLLVSMEHPERPITWTQIQARGLAGPLAVMSFIALVLGVVFAVAA